MITLSVFAILSFPGFHTVTSMLTGHVCYYEYPEKGYRCCKDYYPVNNECVACLPGFTGINCADTCPPKYYGIRCLSVCVCSITEFCHNVNGCVHKPGSENDSKEENYPEESWKSDVRNTTVILQKEINSRNISKGERDSEVTSYVPVAVLVSISFLIFLLCCLVHFNLRFNKRRFPSFTHRVLYWRRSQSSDSTREQRQTENDYVEDNTYADIRISRMLPGPSTECSNNTHPSFSTQRYQNEKVYRASERLKDAIEYAHCESEPSGVYNSLSYRDRVAVNLSEYGDTSTIERNHLRSTRTNEYMRIYRKDSEINTNTTTSPSTTISLDTLSLSKKNVNTFSDASEQMCTSSAATTDENTSSILIEDEDTFSNVNIALYTSDRNSDSNNLSVVNTDVGTSSGNNTDVDT